MIDTPEKLYGWFQDRRYFTQDQSRGVNVSTKIMAEVLLSVRQGRMTIGAQRLQIKFDNQGGGVWRAFI